MSVQCSLTSRSWTSISNMQRHFCLDTSTYKGNTTVHKRLHCIYGIVPKLPADGPFLGSNAAMQLKHAWHNEQEVGNMANKSLCDLVVVRSAMKSFCKTHKQKLPVWYQRPEEATSRPPLSRLWHQAQLNGKKKHNTAVVMQHTESASHVVLQSADMSNGNVSSRVYTWREANGKHVWSSDRWRHEINSKQNV